MRHRKRGRKLGRTTSHRNALFRNQATALFEHEQIRSTLHKCKELRRVAEKLITLAKQDTLQARRRAAGMLYGSNLHYKPRRGESGNLQKQAILQKLFEDIAPRYQDRNGGYTRIIRGELRRGDGAQMAYIQLV